jgi:arylsulfatase A-like enzyme
MRITWWRIRGRVGPARRAALVLALSAASAASSQVVAGPGTQRPNIVLIMADDLGFSDIGPYGGEIHTPNLDRLAADGLRFTQFYNTARCSPTRASLLTGLYSHQAGVGHMPDGYARRVRETFNSPSYTDHLAYHTPTIAEVLRKAGYATYMTGKWHLGYVRSQWPVDRGFDRSFALIPGAMNYFGYGLQNTGRVEDVLIVNDGERYSPPREGFFATDAWSDHAVQYVREHDTSRPFFLYVAHNAPHWPLHAPAEDIARYRGRYLKGWDRIREERYRRLTNMGLIDPAWKLAPRPDRVPAWDSLSDEQKDRWDLEMAIYAAQVERMDAGIGRVLQALREKGIEDNTLVVFVSDNGGAAEDPNRSLEGSVLGGRDSYEGYGIRGAHVSSAPFRRTKKWVHEGGIATPFIVRWPAAIEHGGALRHEPGHVIDLMPTLLEGAGATFPDSLNGQPTVPLEGVSLIPAFESKPLSTRTIVWEHEGNRAIRQGRWKLVSAYPGEWELYDMDEDRTELNDLSRRHPDRVRRLIRLWEAWADRVDAQPWDLLGAVTR